ncbi:hypothetical protein BDR26DRAFT_897550 [Obelidium mucronatum]|nr:hypothetical protein BDR26DRAFT_897550 [Obelidium mucronatum]
MQTPASLGRAVHAFAILYRPLADRPVQPTAEWQAAFAGHRAWLETLHGARRLVLAGPLEAAGGDAPQSGLVVVLARDQADAAAVARLDPLVSERRRHVVVQPWTITYAHSGLANQLVLIADEQEK